jgi:UPF0716 protein FxsA
VFKYLFLAFTVIPLVELYLLLLIGRHVGALPTVMLVLVTGLIGALLARKEGLRVVRRWQQSLARGRMPEEGILGGLLVLVGGVLLVTPGVLTDVVGFLLLLPPSRRWIARRVRRVLERRIADGTVRVTTFQSGPFPGGPFGPPPGAPFEEPPTSPLRMEHRLEEEDADFTEEGDGPRRR